MNVTTVLQSFIVLLCSLITGLLIPFIRSKTTAQDREDIRAWVKIAVEAAEQMYKGNGTGANKKAYVVEFLKAHNIVFDAVQINALIESEVLKLHEEMYRE